MATSKSAKETFSRLGMFGDRAMPRIDHIPDPNARKIIEQSDKTFGNRYNVSSNANGFHRYLFPCNNKLCPNLFYLILTTRLSIPDAQGAIALDLAFQDMTGISNGFAGIGFAGKTDLGIIREALEKNRIQIQDGWLGRFLNIYLLHLRTATNRGMGHVKPGILDLLDALVANQEFHLGLLTGNIEEGARTQARAFWIEFVFPDRCVRQRQ